MSRLPRRDLIEEPEVSIYHCVQRAVWQPFLCGQVAVTGQNFDYRKAGMQQRSEFLAGQFGIEVLSFAVMSNTCTLCSAIGPLWSKSGPTRKSPVAGGFSSRDASCGRLAGGADRGRFADADGRRGTVGRTPPAAVEPVVVHAL